MNNYSADAHAKNVYAHFGLALYLAQVLEHGLANALMCAELLPRSAGKPVSPSKWESEFDAFMDRQYEQTLGRLIRSLKSSTSVPAELEQLLVQALETRNFMTHHFFRERAETFMCKDGRESMIRELELAQKLFQSADEKLTEIVKPLREKYGLTDERLQPLIDEYLQSVKQG